MALLGKILAFLKRVPEDLIWFAAAPKDWDPEMGTSEMTLLEAVRITINYTNLVKSGWPFERFH